MIRTLPGIFIILFLLSPSSRALTALDDNEMGEVAAQGLALALDDFRARFSPTSYVHAVGTPTGTDAFEQADMLWYGASLSSDTAVAGWDSGCSPGIANMGCPIGGRLTGFATHDNPFLLRVFQYDRHPSGAVIRDYQGNASSPTVLEFLWPTNQQPYKYSFWGEARVIEGNGAGEGETELGAFQAQTVFSNTRLSTGHDGASGLGENTKLRFFQHSDVDDPTFALIYENHYQGNMRISVAQTQDSADTLGVAPSFNSVEGLYTMNVEVYFPMGQLNYQSVTFDDAVVNGVDGNFKISMTRIPNVPEIYNDFYSLKSGDDLGYVTAFEALRDPSSVPARYSETHGYLRIGDWSPQVSGGVRNAGTDLNDGIIFHSSTANLEHSQFVASASRPDTGCIDCSSTPPPISYSSAPLNHVNLGDGRISGMLINNLEIISLGAQP